MFRLILLLLVGYFIFKLLPNSSPTKKSPRPRRPSSRETPAIEATVLKSCPACGTFFQESQGIISNGVLYCSQNCTVVNRH